MSNFSAKELFVAGVHFGSPAAKWNPKMKPYIFAKKNGIHVIDIRETLTGLIRACAFLRKVAQSGKKVLFVGTKRQAQDIIRQEAGRAESYFVVHRWLGGTMTNMETMRKRVSRLEELEALETSGQLESFSKKMISNLTREHKKIHRNFEGIRKMDTLPGALVVVDPKQEAIAIAEAIKMDIPVIGLVDTDCDPDPVDFIIPANDDSQSSIQAILAKIADTILDGAKNAKQFAAEQARAGKTAAAPAAAEAEEAAADGIEVPTDLSKRGAFTMPD